jgi:hypothetical protein
LLAIAFNSLIVYRFARVKSGTGSRGAGTGSTMVGEVSTPTKDSGGVLGCVCLKTPSMKWIQADTDAKNIRTEILR